MRFCPTCGIRVNSRLRISDDAMTVRCARCGHTEMATENDREFAVRDAASKAKIIAEEANRCTSN